MDKTIGVFDHIVLGGVKHHDTTGLYPASPIVQVCLQQWCKSENAEVVITPHLMTAGEIDSQIDLLIADLEAVRIRAKSALALTDRKEHC